jgi:hypothetical protein
MSAMFHIEQKSFINKSCIYFEEWVEFEGPVLVCLVSLPSC